MQNLPLQKVWRAGVIVGSVFLLWALWIYGLHVPSVDAMVLVGLSFIAFLMFWAGIRDAVRLARSGYDPMWSTMTRWLVTSGTVMSVSAIVVTVPLLLMAMTHVVAPGATISIAIAVAVWPAVLDWPQQASEHS